MEAPGCLRRHLSEAPPGWRHLLEAPGCLRRHLSEAPFGGTSWLEAHFGGTWVPPEAPVSGGTRFWRHLCLEAPGSGGTSWLEAPGSGGTLLNVLYRFTAFHDVRCRHPRIKFVRITTPFHQYFVSTSAYNFFYTIDFLIRFL